MRLVHDRQISGSLLTIKFLVRLWTLGPYGLALLSINFPPGDFHEPPSYFCHNFPCLIAVPHVARGSKRNDITTRVSQAEPHKQRNSITCIMRVADFHGTQNSTFPLFSSHYYMMNYSIHTIFWYLLCQTPYGVDDLNGLLITLHNVI